LPGALAAAEKRRLPKRRDMAWEAVAERMDGGTDFPDGDTIVRLNRALYI
jgi:hypothetical protein